MRIRLISLTCLAAACLAVPAVCTANASATGQHGQQIYGVTVDEITNLDQIVASLANLPRTPTVRLTFDPGLEPAYYAQAVNAIGQVASIMAQPVDSSEVASYTPAQYISRFETYLSAFQNQVAIWEIGNEVNGNWLGPTADVVADIEGAYEAVRQAGGETALTLSYEPDCGSDMFGWSAANIPRAMRDGLDYVLVSYYAEDCDGIEPTTQQWTQVFWHLRQLFPHAKLGFGETGANPADPLAYQLATLNRYYDLCVNVPGYIGGYFWWYYTEEMVPYEGNVLWQALFQDIDN
jgi:hypothetical protein